ncbi:hypothetical protein LIER_36328 [Lithospermum erythrorhizon]|uniref:DCD domain-containing protein n=1 Tax=Lithospermum erythrorhizon TaxID=34254 RepID=A0AAV3P893_LITER
MENNQSSFFQFSDQLRLETSNLSNLSLNDSIWSTNYVSKRPEDRRNFDLRVGGEVNLGNSHVNSGSSFASPGGQGSKSIVNSDYTLFNGNQWNIGNISPYSEVNGGFNKGVYQNNSNNIVNFDYGKVGYNNVYKNNFGVNLDYGKMDNDSLFKNNNVDVNFEYGKMGNNNVYKNNYGVNFEYGKGGNNNVYMSGKYGKNVKNDDFKNGKKSKNNNKESKREKEGDNNGVDKRFKTLPASESLPRNETIGGYIFVCNNDTMAENLKRELFGLPPRYRDSVRAITPGLPLFLYNYSTHQMHGIFEAATFGGTNIDPTAWEDKKNPGESRFPAQVCVVTRKVCEPLEEDSFRPILHHYDGPKFRLELSIPEALSLLDKFDNNDA